MSESLETIVKSPRYKTNEISIQVDSHDNFEFAIKPTYLDYSSLCGTGKSIGQFLSIKKFNDETRYFKESKKKKPENKKAFINRISVQELDNHDILMTGEIKPASKNKNSRCARRSLYKKSSNSTSSINTIKCQSNSECRLKTNGFINFTAETVKQKPNIYNPLINFTPYTVPVQYQQPNPKLYSKYLSPYSGCRIKKFIKNQVPSTRSSFISSSTRRHRFP